MTTYETLLERLVLWANDTHEVQAIFVIGSRTREHSSADAFSDLDLVMVVTETERFLSSDEWIKSIGDYWMEFTENTFGGGKERRVLFESALDVDFCLFSEARFRKTVKESETQDIFRRGFRVLLDRAELAGLLSDVVLESPSCVPPTEGEFLNQANDFWFHTVWITKKLERGELWVAITCLNCYMKRHLLRMLEYHAHVTHGWDYDTWHDGRFLDKWAEQDVKAMIPNTFAHYDKDDCGKSLLATMDLYHALAVQVAEALEFEYPLGKEQRVTAWVKKALTSLS